MHTFLFLAYLLNWGWLRIGPPYIYININPVLVQIGPLALRWYGLMYVVAILIGLWSIKGYTQRKGISQRVVDRVVWWCIAAGVIGGRLYFVVQQPDLVSGYLLQPWRILATWEGGMAFFGAIFPGAGDALLACACRAGKPTCADGCGSLVWGDWANFWAYR